MEWRLSLEAIRQFHFVFIFTGMVPGSGNERNSGTGRSGISRQFDDSEDELQSDELLDARHGLLSCSTLETSFMSTGVESLLTSVSDLFQSSQMFKIQEETTIDHEVQRLAAEVAATSLSNDDTENHSSKRQRQHQVDAMLQEAFQHSRSSTDAPRPQAQSQIMVAEDYPEHVHEQNAPASHSSQDSGWNPYSGESSIDSLSPWASPERSKAVSVIFPKEMLPSALLDSSPCKRRDRSRQCLHPPMLSSPTTLRTQSTASLDTVTATSVSPGKDLPPKLPTRGVVISPPRNSCGCLPMRQDIAHMTVSLNDEASVRSDA